MSALYTYENLSPDPCTPYITTQVMYGAMGSMDLGVMNWSSETKILTIAWGHELSIEEKAVLDALVAASLGKVRVSKDRGKIMDEIFWTAYSQGGIGRVVELCDGLDHVSSMLAALDNMNYPLARQRVGKALSEGWITQADCDLALSKIPENEYE